MIPHDVLEDLRQRIQLSEVVGERVKLERRGRSFVGLCPFHKEKTPSFHVNDERGYYYCFGCHASGDSIAFLRETEGLSFTEAVLELAERCGIQVTLNQTDSERKQQEESRRRRDELYAVNQSAATFFQQCLQEHPLRHYAQQELERRGLSGTEASVTEALTAFCIGYAPCAWDGLSQHLRAAGLSVRAAEQVGLLVVRKSGGGYYDRFRHRLMFAIHDLKGRVIGFSGRVLAEPTATELQSAGMQGPLAEAGKYINSPESPVYKKRETVFGLFQARNSIRSADNAVIVEGNFDVVSLHARGMTRAVAPLGTAFTPEQAASIKRYAPNVTLLFDADDAGRRAARAARGPCLEQGIGAKVASLPDGMDPDDFVRERGNQELEARLRAARSMLEYLIDTTLDRFNAADARDKAGKIKEVTELIQSEDDPAVRAMAQRHADAIAERLGIADVQTFKALAATVRRAVQGRGGAGAKQESKPLPPDAARSPARRAEIAREILGALFEYPELLHDADVNAALSSIEGEFADAIASVRRAGEQQNAALFLEALSENLRPLAQQRIAAPKLSDRDVASRVLIDNVQKLTHLLHKRHSANTIEQLHRAAATGEFEQQLALLEEQARRARERRGL